MKKILLNCFFVVIVFTFFSCQREDEKVRENLKKSIENYVQKNLPKGQTLDSISIQNIDSLTEFTYIMFYQQFLENSLEMLNMEMNYALTNGENQKASDKMDQISMVWTKSDEYSAYIDRQKGEDKTPFKMFFVVTKVYYKLPNNTQDIQDIGFPIDQNFNVVELNFDNGPAIP